MRTRSGSPNLVVRALALVLALLLAGPLTVLLVRVAARAWDLASALPARPAPAAPGLLSPAV